MLHLLIFLSILSADPQPTPVADDPLLLLVCQEQDATKIYETAVADAKMAHDSLAALTKQQAKDLADFQVAQRMALQRSASADAAMFQAKAAAFNKLIAIRDQQEKILRPDGRRTAEPSPAEPPSPPAASELPPPPVNPRTGATTMPETSSIRKKSDAHLYFFTHSNTKQECDAQRVDIELVKASFDIESVKEIPAADGSAMAWDASGNVSERQFSIEGSLYSVKDTPVLVIFRGGQEAKIFHGLATAQQIVDVIK